MEKYIHRKKYQVEFKLGLSQFKLDQLSQSLEGPGMSQHFLKLFFDNNNIWKKVAISENVSLFP